MKDKKVAILFSLVAVTTFVTSTHLFHALSSKKPQPYTFAIAMGGMIALTALLITTVKVINRGRNG